MNYRVGDQVIISMVSIDQNRRQIIPEPREGSQEVVCQVIGVDRVTGFYKVAIEGDVVGYMVSKFHTTYLGVSAAFLGKKFQDIPENYIVRRK